MTSADKAVELYESGMTMEEVGDELGMSASWVWEQTRKADIETRSTGPGRIDLPVDEIIQCWQSGESLKALSEEYGVSRLTIKARVRERGYETSQDHYKYEDDLEDYLDDIRSVADDLGRDPSFLDYMFQGELRPHTIMRRESLTWSELKEKAGVVD